MFSCLYLKFVIIFLIYCVRTSPYRIFLQRLLFLIGLITIFFVNWHNNQTLSLAHNCKQNYGWLTILHWIMFIFLYNYLKVELGGKNKANTYSHFLLFGLALVSIGQSHFAFAVNVIYSFIGLKSITYFYSVIWFAVGFSFLICYASPKICKNHYLGDIIFFRNIMSLTLMIQFI